MSKRLWQALTGRLVIIGFGSIGQGFLPLLERHFEFDPHSLTIIDPVDAKFGQFSDKPYKTLTIALTEANYESVLRPCLSPGGFCINLSVETSSLQIMRFCRDIGVPYIDTVVEPWEGTYFDTKLTLGERSNYVMREGIRDEKRRQPGGTTAVSCCGANPGMISWLAKEGLMILAAALGVLSASTPKPRSREEWAMLMCKCGVKGMHIAERDTQCTGFPKPLDTFVQTWSVNGFQSEGFGQPCELGWGTHETWVPPDSHTFATGCQASIYLGQPGANTRVRSWCPTLGAHHGFLVTHNEAISLADYFTVGEGPKPAYRPTVHYAYSVCDDAVLSVHEAYGKGKLQEKSLILAAGDIVPGGFDELGILFYGHRKNAFWYGSTLTIDETKTLVPHQNATALQVTSAVAAGVAWALNHPEQGIVEAEEMDHDECLAMQRRYLGKVWGCFTDWNPLSEQSLSGLFESRTMDRTDPWQFRNVLVREEGRPAAATVRQAPQPSSL